MTLAQAITEIEKKHYSFQLPIQMIEIEDGSGMKFNYRLKGEQKNRFIDFTPKTNEFVGRFMAAAKIMNKWTKVLIVFAIISVGLSSCSRYYISGNCNNGSCGVWYPKKFTK